MESLDALCQLRARSACAIIKHGIPCAVAMASTVCESYRAAFAGDPESAFGGIICFNQTLDRACASAILDSQFCEVVVAPAFESGALALYRKKPNLRVIECSRADSFDAARPHEYRGVYGGTLRQQPDTVSAQELTFDKDIDPQSREDWRISVGTR